MKIHKIYKKVSSKILLVLLVCCAFSCAELDENPEEVQLSPEALSSVETLRDIVTGIYRNTFNGARWSDYYLASYGGDDVTTHSSKNKIGFRESDWRSQTISSDRTLLAYRDSYIVIAAANVAINAQDDIVNGDLDLKDIYLGECYFLRALSYLHLTRTYGRVPIVLEVNSTEAPVRAEFVEIYQLIEADLQKAESLLPNNYPGIPALGARPSKGAAKAFLARLYMHWAGYPVKDNGKYALAATKAKEVIDGGFGYELSDSLRKMWTVADRFNHNEGVFTLVACAAVCNVGNRTTGRLGLPSTTGGWNETFGEIAFYEDMEAAAMAEGTMVRYNDTYISELIPRGKKPHKLGADWRTFSDEAHPILRKVAGGDMSESVVVNSTNTDLNRYVLRYADVLLTYAEASGRSGNVTADAWEALNKVRRRAAGLDSNTPDAGIDLIAGDLAELAYTERKWELAGEFERWHDLVRMERVADALANRSSEELVDIANSKTPSLDTSGKYFYFNPLPQVVIDRAPQLAD